MRVVIFLVIFTFSLNTYAGLYQTNDLTRLSEEISKHGANQLEMLGGISPGSLQYDAASNLYDAAIRVQVTVDFLSQIGDIYNLLVSLKDKEILKKYIKINKTSYSKLCEINLRQMNQKLPIITNPALLNESTVLRDKISLSCEALGNF